MKQFVISQELAQGVLNYLATQPYAQVFQLIQGLQNLQEVGGGQSSEPLAPQAVEEAPAE